MLAGRSARVHGRQLTSRRGLDKTFNDLRDKRLLTFDQDKLSRVELTAKKQDRRVRPRQRSVADRQAQAAARRRLCKWTS